MERAYLFITSGYRVLLTIIIISLIWSLNSSGITESGMIKTALLGGYALVFSIFGNQRLISYLEWLAVLGLIVFLPGITMVNFLLLMPFIQLISIKAKQYDLLYLAITMMIFQYYRNDGLIEIITTGAAIYAAGFILNMNFKKIDILDKMVKEEKTENEILRYDNSVKRDQIEVVSKLFIHKQHLDDINDINLLVDQMMNSSMDYFNAYYVTLYYYKDGLYHKLGEKGGKGKYDVPEILNKEKGNEMYYDRQLLRVPITYERRPWGSLAIYGKRSRLGEDGQIVFFPFEESDFEILSIYVDSVMARLKEIRRNEKLKKAALFDRLTNLPNRMYLEGDLFKEKVEMMKKERKTFAVMLLDIDKFKSFNDTFGHDVGDEVLKVVSRIANERIESFNQNDVIGRWGGEEFLGFLTGNPEECLAKAEAIREEVEKFPFKYRKITVSIGFAFFGIDGKNLKDVSKKADIALYHSKENGRNQVTVYKRGMEQ